MIFRKIWSAAVCRCFVEPANGVRTFLSALCAASFCGQECPHSVLLKYGVRRLAAALRSRLAGVKLGGGLFWEKTISPSYGGDMCPLQRGNPPRKSEGKPPHSIFSILLTQKSRETRRARHACNTRNGLSAVPIPVCIPCVDVSSTQRFIEPKGVTP